MESIGEKLKQAREQKGLQLEQVGRETNIAKRYLVALEEEDFQAFPGEPYLLGFLRNYADYLGLKSEDLVSAYRNLRIQEQPIPVRELLATRTGPHPAAIIASIAVGLAIVTGIVFIVLNSGRNVADGSDLGTADRVATEYEVTSSPFEHRLYQGDTLLFPLREEKHILSVESISDQVAIKHPLGVMRLSLGDGRKGLDLDLDNASDLFITVTDFDRKKPGMGANVLIESAAGLLAAAASREASALPSGSASPAAATSPAPSLSPVPAADASKGQVLIEARTSPYPFTMSVTFRQYCMFRHEVDKKDRTERYYRKGEQVTANANNGIKVWTSNATACTIQVIAGGKTVTVDMGRAGEVSVKDIKWVQVDSGWALTALPVD